MIFTRIEKERDVVDTISFIILNQIKIPHILYCLSFEYQFPSNCKLLSLKLIYCSRVMSVFCHISYLLENGIK